MLNLFKTKQVISLKEVFEKTQNKNNAFVDVRTTPEYQSLHAKGAESVPLSTIDNNVIEKIKKYNEVYVICQSGGRSSIATALLISSGVNAINVDGGTNAWKAEGLPTV